jgi:hypothetical protein
MERAAALPLNQALAYGVQAHAAAVVTTPSCFLYVPYYPHLSLLSPLRFRFLFDPSLARPPSSSTSPHPHPLIQGPPHATPHENENPSAAAATFPRRNQLLLQLQALAAFSNPLSAQLL